MLRQMLEGFVFIKGHSIFSFLITMTFFNSVFGMSLIYLMPLFAEKVLEVGPEGMGFLMGAFGVGSLVGTTVSAGLGDFQKRGWLLVGGAVLFGSSLILFSLSPWYYVSLGLVTLAGTCNATYTISAMTTLQALVPDQFRGRVMGFYAMTWSLQPLGAMQAGAIADFVGARFAGALGGILVASFALGLAVRNPEVRSIGARKAAAETPGD